ncbi:MAG: ComEC/Rec2 family competence protein, partial [Nitrospirae bacterium]|nr:ComEC/Rec2 family competence protein [Nitrospirota bacterium]
IYLTSILLERDGSGVHSLSLATMITLLHDPRALFQISFQLSYIAVLALCVVARREEGGDLTYNKAFHSRFIRKLRLYGFLTISVFWVTTPLVAAYFNQFGWVGLVSNSVVIPYIGAVVVPLGILSSVLTLWRSQADLLMGNLNEFSLNLGFWIVHFFSTFPGSEIHLASPPPYMIFCFYGFTLFVFFRKALKDRLIRLLGIMILGSFLTVGIVHGTVREKPLIQVTFLDVGQGDAAVLQLADQVVVIDGGGTFGETFDIGRSVVAPYLWDQGIHRIDLMIATHPQMDHMKGLFYLSDHFDVIEAWGNGDEDETLLGRRFKHHLGERGIPYSAVFQDHQDHGRGPCRIDVLNPLYPKGPQAQETATKLNDRAIVLRVSCNRLTFLFTGDIEQRGIDALLESGVPLESTVLKVPHHGSRGSADPDWVSAVCPQLAVFSAGYQNAYRHPSPEALEAYQVVKAHTHRTDLSGAMTLQSDGYKLRYHSAEEMLEKPVSWSRPDRIIFQEIENLRKRWEGVS